MKKNKENQKKIIFQSNRISKRIVTFSDENKNTTVEINKLHSVLTYNIWYELLYRLKEIIVNKKNLEDYNCPRIVEIEIPLSELSKKPIKDYTRIRNACKNLANMRFHLTVENNDGTVDVRDLPVFAETSVQNIFAKQGKKQIFLATFNFKILKLITDITKGYTSIDKSVVISLKTVYSKRIYELLEQYKTTGWYEENLDNFQKIINIDKYFNSYDLKRRVLDPSIKEINEKSDYKVSYELFKKNLQKNKYDTIKFTIRKKNEVIDIGQNNKNVPINHSLNLSLFVDFLSKYIFGKDIKKGKHYKEKVYKLILAVYEEKFEQNKTMLDKYIKRIKSLEKEVKNGQKNERDMYALVPYILEEDYEMKISEYKKRFGL